MPDRQGSQSNFRRVAEVRGLLSRTIGASLLVLISCSVALSDPLPNRVSGKIIDTDGAPVALAVIVTVMRLPALL